MPLSCWHVFVKIFNEVLIELNKGFIAQLHSGFGQGDLRNELPGKIRGHQKSKETIELILIRPGCQVDEKSNQGWKRQFSLAGKVFFRFPMTVKKILGKDNIFNEISNIGTVLEKQGPCQKFQFLQIFSDIFFLQRK